MISTHLFMYVLTPSRAPPPLCHLPNVYYFIQALTRRYSSFFYQHPFSIPKPYHIFFSRCRLFFAEMSRLFDSIRWASYNCCHLSTLSRSPKCKMYQSSAARWSFINIYSSSRHFIKSPFRLAAFADESRGQRDVKRRLQ